METWMRRWTVAGLLVVASATAVSAQQTGAVTGSVVDRETGQPVTGAQVMVTGTQRGALTDDQGRFLVPEVPVGQATLRVQFIGYATAEQTVQVTAGGTATVRFELQAQAVQLDELVVTGYGTQRREDLTASVAHVSSEEFIDGPARDAASLIAGKIPGLVVNTASGDPRAQSEIMLRGIPTISGPRQPFILVDGVPGDLRTVAPEDIASIDVLKDGSAAAVYGSRASNGVILITTKKYEPGMPPTIRYDGYVSVQTLYKTPDFLDADDYRRLIDEGYDFVDHGFNTDWQDLLLRQPVSYRHNVTVTGGAMNTHYTGSFGYNNAQGIFERSERRELTGRLNIGHSMFDGRLEANLNLLTRVETRFDGADYNYAWRQVLIRNPTDRVYDDDGTYQERGTYFYPNPVGLVNEFNGDREDRNMRLHGRLTFRPIESLSLSVLAGTEKQSRLGGSSNTQMAVRSNLDDHLRASRWTDSRDDRILELTGTYSSIFGGHSVTLLGGYSYQDVVSEGFDASNQDFPTDVFGYNALERGDGLTSGRAGVGSDKSGYKVIGFFGRLNYDWNNRLLLMGSLRYEGNSKFGADHKWGLFPAVSAGWRLSEESFMEGSPFNDLKLRAGYGVTGIAPNSPYLSLTAYSYRGRFPFNGQWVQGIEPSRNPNPDLRWERKEEINVGLDFSLFDYRLAGSLDVYQRDTKDMLYNYNVPSPPFLYGNILANVGHMRNSGIEAQLTYDIVRSADLRWQATVNGSLNRNKLVSLSNEVYETDECFNTGYTGEPVQKSTHRVCIGEPIGNFWGLKSVGIDDDGRWIVEDTLGNAISIEDAGNQYHVLGNGIPDAFLAFNNSIRYKNWDLNVNMRGAFGHQILNFQRMFYENPTNTEYNMLESAFDPVYGKRLLDYELDYVSYYVEDGDYWKIDNVTLGYTLDPSALPLFSTVVSRARIYLSGRNLLTITGYKGMDPEVSLTRDPLAPGNDYRDTYPTTRTFTMGMSLTF
ncbi:MAG TPA: SusC/RagA family TonB-linked outer membrane protein [Longimicrobiales bacterium]